MLREDEVFASKLALAGPWGHVPLILGSRNIKVERMSKVAQRLDVPAWQAHVATALQCREILHCINHSKLSDGQKRKARTAVGRMYLRRQARTFAHRSRRLGRITISAIRPGTWVT
jgi:hypothetical protein